MHINPWKVSTFVLLFGIAGATLVHTAEAERQPKMRAALITLKKAKQQLEAATPDKGGHRVKAIEAVNTAIAETQAGIDFDNAH